MLSLFRRKPADDSVESVTAEEVEAGLRPRAAHTPSKRDQGKATPKRKAAGRRLAQPPPTTRREAVRRARQKQRESRAEARAGMMAGKEEYLLPRDKGPERGLIRDIVDSRRNVASYFLVGALVVLLGTSQAMPRIVQLGANIFWIVLAVGVVVDSLLLSLKIKRLLRERFPHSTARPRGNYFYAIMRSMSFRRMRIPSPRVKIGETI